MGIILQTWYILSQNNQKREPSCSHHKQIVNVRNNGQHKCPDLVFLDVEIWGSLRTCS